MVSVQRDNESWIAEADFQLHVADGLVDTVRLDIPLQWIEPYQLDPPLPHEVFTIPGENRRQLLIHPVAPIKDHFRMRVRGRLSLTGGERLRVPEVTASWVGKLDRFVVLPTQLELQQVEWETVGLRATRLPDEFRKTLTAPETFTAYQALGEHFQAALKSVERMAGVPLVRLADVQIAWRPDGVCYGTAAFDIEPAGAVNCLLQIPPHYHMIHATVTGLPAMLEPAGQNRWRVSLGSPQLPQHVEVLFSGQLPQNSWGTDRWRLDAPAILDLEVDRTLWTIYAPSQAGQAAVLEGQSNITAAQQELLRSKTVAAMQDLANDVAADQLPEEIVRWYRPWQGRFERSRAIVRRESLAASRSKPSHEENEVRALEQDQAAVAKRLGASTAMQPRPQCAFCDEPSEILSLLQTGHRPTLGIFRGGERQVNIRYPLIPSGDAVPRFMAALACVAGGLASVWLLKRTAWTTRSAASYAVVIGLVWWLVLHPSPLGLAVLLIGLAAKVRRLWKSRRQSLISAPTTA